MEIKKICRLLAVLLMFSLFTACGEDEEPYPGASLTNYPITAEALRINVKDHPKMYVMTNASMDITDTKMVTTFTEKNYRLIQIINEYFRAQELETLQTADIKSTAGAALAKRINDEFKTDVVQTVYLPDFFIYT